MDFFLTNAALEDSIQNKSRLFSRARDSLDVPGISFILSPVREDSIYNLCSVPTMLLINEKKTLKIY